jgi:hypothetical protein
MEINVCCESAMRTIDGGGIAFGFNQTGQRNPIGKDMNFYTCLACETRWARAAQTHHPYGVVWDKAR